MVVDARLMARVAGMRRSASRLLLTGGECSSNHGKIPQVVWPVWLQVIFCFDQVSFILDRNATTSQFVAVLSIKGSRKCHKKSWVVDNVSIPPRKDYSVYRTATLTFLEPEFHPPDCNTRISQFGHIGDLKRHVIKTRNMREKEMQRAWACS